MLMIFNELLTDMIIIIYMYTEPGEPQQKNRQFIGVKIACFDTKGQLTCLTDYSTNPTVVLSMNRGLRHRSL